MSKRHLFSASLFDTLFQHNLISSDGYVKATDDQIFAFRKFLVRQARDKTTNLYKVRKEMVDEVCNLLKEDELTPKETKKLVLLLHQLNLKITPEGILESEEPEDRKPSYLGTSEPNKSIWERQLLEEEKRLEVLRRDLKELDDWLGEIARAGTKVHKSAIKLPADSKRDEFRYRERTARRNLDMERARRRLILTYHAENAKSIKKTLAHKDHPGRVRFEKSVASETERKKESGESFVTAASEFSFLLRTPVSVTQNEMELARNIFNSCEEDESHLRVKKSKATEKIEVQPGVQLDIDEYIKFRPSTDITTIVSEPIMEVAKDDFEVDLKCKRYKSEPTFDGKSSATGPTIDEAKQYIIIYGDEGNATEFKVEDDERGSDEKIKPDKQKISIETDDNRPKSILKVSRKSMKMSSSSSKGNKRVSKERSMEFIDHKNRPTSKRQSTENSKGQKATSSSSLARKKVPEVAQGVKDVKPVGRDKDENNAKAENKQEIIDPKVYIKEKRNILNKCDDEDGTKHQIDSQVEEKSLDGGITPKEDKRASKQRSVEYKDHKNRPISKRQSAEDRKEGKTTNSSLKRKNVAEITRGEKEVKPADQDKDKNIAKIDNKQNIIDSTDNNDEMGSILKTMNVEDENKLQAERRHNLTQGKVDNKNYPGIESEGDEVLSSEQELSLEKDFKIAQLTEPIKDDFADDKNKMTTGNQEKNIDSEENSKKKEESSKSDNEGNIEEQSKLKDVSKNKNDDELRDKIIKGHLKVKPKEKHEKVIDSEVNSKKKEDSSKSDNEGNIEGNVSKSKKDDGQSDKTIKAHAEAESKEDKVLTEDHHLSLEKDFQLAQRYELEKSDPKSRSEKRFVSDAGFVENIKDFEEENKQKDDDVKSEKYVKDSAESNPEDSEVLTLDQQLSLESEINFRKSKEMRQRNSKANSSENEGNINTKNAVGMSDAKQNADESNPKESQKDIEEKNKDDDKRSDKTIKAHAKAESKEDQVLTEDQHLRLEKDFQLAQRYELEKSDPKSRSEERFVSNAGSEENIKDFEEEDKQKDENVKSGKEATDSAESSPEDSEVLTLDQQLSLESEINFRKSKEMRQRNLKANSLENDGNINIKNAAGMSDSSENAKQNADESNPEESPKSH